MTALVLSPSEQRQLVRRWSETGPLLERRRRDELGAQSATESLQAAHDMLQLGGMLPADPLRERSPGIIEMQRLFARGRSSGKP